MASLRLGQLAVVSLGGWVVACNGDLAGPSGRSGVTIDLSSYVGSVGRICDDEADTVTLTITETGPPLRAQELRKPIPSNCRVEFDDIKVDSGMVHFRAVVKGNGRPLLVGDTAQLIAQEGWAVQLPPDSAVAAISVPIDTIGTAPTVLDVVLIRESDGQEDTLRVSARDLVPDTIYSLAAGDRIVELLGNQCDVQPQAIATVKIPTDPNDVIQVSYTVLDCPVGSISVSTMTAGTGGPPDYTLKIGGSPQPLDSVSIGPDTTRDVDEILIGQRQVWLDGLEDCSVTPPDTVTVMVQEGQTAPASFDVQCPGTPADSGWIKVATTTMGSGGPPNYFYSVDSGTPQPIDPNEMIVSPDTVGPHTVTLSGLGSCTTPDTTLGVTVPVNDTVQAVFPVTCTNPPADSGAIEVVTTTTGSGGPPNYFYSVDSGTPQPIGPNEMIVIPDTVGMHSVALSGLGSCTVPDTTLDVTVTVNDTVPAVFSVTCASSSGAIRINTHTINPTGLEFAFEVVPGPADTIGQNSTRVVGLQPGSYSVRLQSFEPCVMLSQNPQSVVVSVGDTVLVAFEVDCSPPSEPPGGSASLIKSGPWSQFGLWTRSPLLDPRRRWWYAARASDGDPAWIM